MKVGPDILKNLTPRPKVVRKLLGYLAMLLFSTLTKTKVRGRHHLPKKGPFIIVVNHFSLIDGAFVVFGMLRPGVFLMASDQHVDWFYFWAPWIYGLIPLNREQLAPSVIKKAIAAIKEGEILVIFPEATSHATKLRPAKKGAAYLSAITKVPVVPIGLEGTHKAWESIFRGVRPTVKINIGKKFGPVNLKEYGDSKEDALEKFGDEIMCRIAALMPEKYHGSFRGRKEVLQYKKQNGY